MELDRYVCITADVIGSRTSNKIAQLAAIIVKLNEKMEASLVTAFTVRAGDEIFGVVKGFDKGFAAYKELFNLSKKFDVPFYVGVGFGGVDDKSNSDPDLIGGQAIWNSADALKYLKNGSKDNQYKALNVNSLDEKFRFHFTIGSNKKRYRAVNYLLFFIMERVIKRTEKQREAVSLLDNYPNANYNKLGENLGYKNEKTREANFQKLLSRGDYFLVKEAEFSLVNLIEELYDQERKETQI